MAKKLTPAQRALLDHLRVRPNGDYISGSQVTTARALEKLGLVVLIDNGHMIDGLSGRSDGERWDCTITEKGREA